MLTILTMIGTLMQSPIFYIPTIIGATVGIVVLVANAAGTKDSRWEVERRA